MNDDPRIAFEDIFSILQYESEYISLCWYDFSEEHIVAHVC